MTVLGDLAQATAPGAQGSWEEALRHLGSPPGPQLAELTLGYRVPASVLDWANRLLADAAPGVRPARSVRTGGVAPVVEPVASLADVVARAASIALERAADHVSVGVVAPDDVRAAIAAAVAAIPSIQVVAPVEAKGLEFDAVVVAEPAAVAAVAGGDASAGLRLLYVALTRAVQRLDVVHAEPLPVPLRVPGARQVR